VTDDARFVVKEFSLAHMLETCTDFANEKTQLEFVCQSLGTEALIMTKYHAKYAGEGIEYSWGAAKSSASTLPTCLQKGERIFFDLPFRSVHQENYSRWT
jgi:hypothetical protein